MKFQKMQITDYFDFSEVFEFIEFGIFDIPFANLIKKAKFPSDECQSATDGRIPIIYTDEPKEMFFISLFKKDSSQNHILIKLPTFPKNIEEMLFVYYWLEQLFYTAFEEVIFDVLLNPELIKLLFGNETAKTLQFYCIDVDLCITNYNFNRLLDFLQNYLFIGCSVILDFVVTENADQYTDTLMKFLLNKGEKYKSVCFRCFRSFSLFNLIINHLETSTNFSNKLPVIFFNGICLPRLDLTISERAENIEIHKYSNVTSVTYQLTNKFNPKGKKFNIRQDEKDGRIEDIGIYGYCGRLGVVGWAAVGWPAPGIY